MAKRRGNNKLRLLIDAYGERRLARNMHASNKVYINEIIGYRAIVTASRAKQELFKCPLPATG
jgi:hypothetical protein